MQSWIGLLFWALRVVPQEISVVQSASISTGRPIMSPGAEGNRAFEPGRRDGGGRMQAGTVDPSPSPEMGSAPPPHA